MASNAPQRFRLGPWTVEPPKGAVIAPDGGVQHLEPKVMDVFVCLAENVHELVTREQLLETVWPGSVGSDEQLTRAVSELRRVFNDDPRHPTYIETVPKRGYRMFADVSLDDGNLADPADSQNTPKLGLRWRKPLFILGAMVTMMTLMLTYNVLVDPGIDPLHGAATTVKRSIAVLPFVSLSADPGNEYFADGLSEELLSLLVGVPGLKVIGRTSSFSFKGTNTDLRQIGEKLDVSTVLEGSVRKSGDWLRITAQLVDVSDGTNIWSGSFDREMTDIFTVQDDISAAIIDALQIHLSANPTRGRPTEVVEAYALFLRAKALLNIQDAKTAESLLLQATELDPNFAEAYELLAHLYWTEGESPLPMQKSAAKALAIDPNLLLARALYQPENTENIFLPDIIGALRRAAHGRPNDPVILRHLTWELLIAGYLKEGLRAAENFVEVDPLSPMAHIRHCAALRAVGRLDESSAAMKIAAELTPGGLDWYLGEMELLQHRDQKAIDYFASGLRDMGIPDPTWLEDLVRHAREPDEGPTYLDKLIPVITAAAPPEARADLHFSLIQWHLFFGHLDRYYEYILHNMSGDSTLTDVEWFVWYGMLNRDQGFTAHPKFLAVAEKFGLTDAWDRHGPPDFCSKTGGVWTCA